MKYRETKLKILISLSKYFNNLLQKERNYQKLHDYNEMVSNFRKFKILK